MPEVIMGVYKPHFPKDIIRINDPPISSRAAYIRLVLKLLREGGYEKYYYKKWLFIRDLYLRTLLESYNMLWCEYCGTYLYLIKNKNPDMTNKVATIDHHIPISKGGAIYDPSNFAVSCWPYNHKFGNRMKRKGRRKYPYSIETLKLILSLNKGATYAKIIPTEEQRQNTGSLDMESSHQNNLPRLYSVLS